MGWSGQRRSEPCGRIYCSIFSEKARIEVVPGVHDIVMIMIM